MARELLLSGQRKRICGSHWWVTTGMAQFYYVVTIQCGVCSARAPPIHVTYSMYVLCHAKKKWRHLMKSVSLCTEHVFNMALITLTYNNWKLLLYIFTSFWFILTEEIPILEHMAKMRKQGGAAALPSKQPPQQNKRVRIFNPFWSGRPRKKQCNEVLNMAVPYWWLLG